MITLSQHKHQQKIYAFNVSVHSFVISLRNQYQYVVIHLTVSILLIFSAESSNFSQFAKIKFSQIFPDLQYLDVHIVLKVTLIISTISIISFT